jgi:parallel beta-helix repeat protein
MKYLLPFYFFCSFLTPIYATHYYVSSEIGNDSYQGISQQNPFKTLQKAANSVQPGDTVYVMNGTYTNTDNEPGFFQSQVVFMMRSGTPEAWITFEALEGHHPQIVIQQAFGIRIVAAEPFHTNGTLAYIRLKNLKVVGNTLQIPLCDALNQPRSCNQHEGDINWNYNGSGISIGSENRYAENGNVVHHIEVINCEVSNCAAAGISAYRCDYVTISQCKVYNNGWKSTFGSSGIHIYSPRHSKVVDNVSFHFTISRNEVYNNRNEVPFFNGQKCNGYTDGNGIIIDDANNLQSNNQAYSGRFLIENNVIYENGGSGISLFQSDNITLRNNTTYKNCQLTPDNKKRAELMLVKVKNIQIVNNILYAREKQRGFYKGSKCKEISMESNLVYNSKKNTGLKNYSKENPLFVSVSDSDKTMIRCEDVELEIIPTCLPKRLKLLPESPARGKATLSNLPETDFTGTTITKNNANLGAYQ